MKKIYTLALVFSTVFSLWAAPAPDFTVTTSDGQVRKLYQDYLNQQKVVVLEIFFTTCPPCATHAPYWQSLYQSMLAAHPGQVEFMLLSDKSADTNPLVTAYLNAKGLSMPAAGSDGGSLSAVQPYKNGAFGPFQGTPTFIVIAPGTGEVFYDIRGNSPQESMDLIAQKINDLLPEQDCFLKSYLNNPIDSVEIAVQTTGGFSTSFWASGSYTLKDIPELQDVSYSVTPVKYTDPLQGLSTYDLVKIASHILGLQPFQFPWQAIAADMNCSGSVTTFDIVEGRKVILGINNGFSGCGGATWHFIAEPDGATSDGSCLHFRGIRLGDLTGPYFAPDGPTDDRAHNLLLCDDRQLPAGAFGRIQLHAAAGLNLLGLQLALGTDPDVLRITRLESPLLPGFDEYSFNLDEQVPQKRVPVSWVGSGPVTIKPGETLLDVEVQALQDVRISDVFQLHPALRAEAYDETGHTFPLGMQWQKADFVQTNDISISPNPAKTFFFVSFESGFERDILLQAIDMQGVVIFEEKISALRGPNKIPVQIPALDSGVYALKLAGRPAGKVLLLR